MIHIFATFFVVTINHHSKHQSRFVLILYPFILFWFCCLPNFTIIPVWCNSKHMQIPQNILHTNFEAKHSTKTTMTWYSRATIDWHSFYGIIWVRSLTGNSNANCKNNYPDNIDNDFPDDYTGNNLRCHSYFYYFECTSVEGMGAKPLQKLCLGLKFKKKN